MSIIYIKTHFRKTIPYIMIPLLVINLISGISECGIVLAAGDELNSEAPVISVVDDDDGKLITVIDDDLDSNCCELSYKRKTISDFSMEETIDSVSLSLTQETGKFSGHIKIEDILGELGSGIYTDLKITATDLGGNKAEESLPMEDAVIIDGDNPEVSIGIADENNNEISGVKASDDICYYDVSGKQIKIRIADLQLKEPSVSLKKNGSTINATFCSALSDNPYVKEVIYPFDGEGKYELVICAEDNDGRITEESRIMIRDITSPALQISGTLLSYENGNPLPATKEEEGKDYYYLKDAARVSFSVVEANYGTATVSMVENGSDVASYPVTMTQTPQEFLRRYTQDGIYHVYATTKDMAGNLVTSDTVNFVLDQVPPVIDIQGIRNDQMEEGPVSLAFEATDKNHDFTGYEILVKRSDLNESEQSRSYTFTKDEWVSSEDDKIRKTMTLQEEGIYEVTFKATDKAGNTSKKTVRFYIDDSAPEITHLTYSNVNGFILPKYNHIFSNKIIAIEFDIYDAYVGVDSDKVYVTMGTDTDRMSNPSIYFAHKVVGNHYVSYVPSDFGLSEFNNTITIRASDKMGNEGFYTSNRMIYTTDYAGIKMDCDEDFSGWVNKDILFHTRVEDTKAGIAEIVYRVNNKVIKKVTFDSLIYQYDYDVTASENASSVTGYAVEVEVTNNCGTVSRASRQVYIDKEKPQVQLSGVTDGAHYNTDQEIVTKVKEVSYSDTTTNYVIKRSLEGKETGMSVAVFHPDNHEDTNVFTMLKEGAYEIYAITVDGAGNSTVSNTVHFVIDKTAPKLEISGIKNGAVSGTEISMDFSCEEAYYHTNSVLIRVEKTLDGKTSHDTIGNFPGIAKQSILNHLFSEDGTYKITISSEDKAGNVAVPQTITFTIDRTKPVIRVQGTSNYQLWNRAPDISFVIEESYYTTNQVTIKGTRRNEDGNITELTIPKFISSGKVSALHHVFEQDGVYELEISAKDEAGNTDSRDIHFTVDQSAPDIDLVSQFDGGYYQEFYLADSLEEVFKDLTVISHRILLNGVEYNGTDYIVEEGKYSLYVEAEDELGQRTVKTAEFIIDHTAPKVIFTGVRDRESVHEKGNIMLSLANAEDVITDVRLNGEHLGPDVRNIEYTTYGSYLIEVDCIDKAGNAVTRNIHFVYRNPLTVALISGGMGVIIVFMCSWLWIRTKRRERKEKNHEKSSSI